MMSVLNEGDIWTTQKVYNITSKYEGKLSQRCLRSRLIVAAICPTNEADGRLRSRLITE
jgi:hypothetical protein